MRNILLALLLVFGFSACADLLILKDGKEINGRLVEYSKGAIVFCERETGKNITIEQDKLTRLDLFREYEEKGVYKPEEIKDQLVRKVISRKDFKEYDQYDYICFMSDTTITYKTDGGAVFSHHFLGRVNKEGGKSIGTFYLNYIPGRSDFTIRYARSITDGRITYANDYAVTDTSTYSSYPLYEKAREVKVIIPKVESGSFVEYSYEERYTSRDILDNPQCFVESFTSSVPYLSARVRIEAPAGLKLNLSLRNADRNLLKKSGSGAGVAYSFEMKKIPPYQEEENTPPVSDVFPTLTVSPAYDYAGIAAALAAKYSAWDKSSPALKSACETITASAKSREEKIAALYQFLTKNIVTAWVSLSNTHYYPLDPAVIYEKKMGSKVDKTFLFHALLSELGVKSDFLLLSDRNSGSLEVSVPCVEQFGNLGLKLDNGKLIYVNDDSMTMGDFPGGCQGSPALSLAERKLVDLPYVPAKSFSTFDLNLNENGDLRASVTDKFEGSTQNNYRKNYYLSKNELDKEWEKSIARIHPRAVLQKYEYQNLGDLTNNLGISYSFSASEYPKRAGSMLAFQLPEFYLFSASEVAREQRAYPMFFHGVTESHFVYQVKLPKDYGLAFCPEKRKLNFGGMEFTASFDTSSRSILKVNLDFKRVGDTYPASEYASYKKFIEDIVNFQDEWILLEKK
ncbi:MAG: DUF3857 domain-containing protein [Candidatus Wallbacteria bacterium]|nr:DUF3857 domain-containing protein [Candidatus Wallbacteria bacterium]